MMTKLGRSASDLQREAVKNQYPPFCQEHTVKNCPKTVFLGVKNAVFSSLTKLLTFFPANFLEESLLFYFHLVLFNQESLFIKTFDKRIM